MKMMYCKNCLQPNTRPNSWFDKEGVCPACRYYETLDEVDWDERRMELEPMLEFGRQNSSCGYDCIIGVSGGKDSTRQALYVRDVLKMNPLLVCMCYPPQQVNQRGVDNLSNMIRLGFDCVVYQLAPETWRKAMRKAFLQFANWCRSTEYALYSSVPRTALLYKIPLVFWGENPALQLGDLKTLGKAGWDGNSLRNMNTLSGGDPSWLVDDAIPPNAILQYYYPRAIEMEQSCMQIVYLGFFWKDWSLLDNGLFSALRGLEIRSDHPADIGDIFGITALDEDWVNLNQMIKYLKYGFGRMTDYANEEIRKGSITREDAIEWVRNYDGKCSVQQIESFCSFIDISVDRFWSVVDENVNKELFEKNNSGSWCKIFEIGK